MFKILSTYICLKKIHKMQHLEDSGMPVLYIQDARFLKVNMSVYINVQSFKSYCTYFMKVWFQLLVSGWNWTLNLNRTHSFVMFVEDANFLDNIKKHKLYFSNSKVFVPIAKRFFFYLWRCDPTQVMASSFLMFLDHTQRCTTVGRTPLDE